MNKMSASIHFSCVLLFSPLEVFNINFYGLDRSFFPPIVLLFLCSTTILIFFFSFSLCHIKIKKLNQIVFFSYLFEIFVNLFTSIVLSRRALRFLPFIVSIFF